MEKFQKPSNSVCYTPSSELFRINVEYVQNWKCKLMYRQKEYHSVRVNIWLGWNLIYSWVSRFRKVYIYATLSVDKKFLQTFMKPQSCDLRYP
jgi:hypothetical protein